MGFITGTLCSSGLANLHSSASTNSADPISFNRRKTVSLLAFIVAGGLFMRSYQLAARTIWIDESLTWRTIQFPFPEMLNSVARNCHVPLHYALLKLWTLVFGDSLWVMRGLSVIFGGATIIGVYLFSNEAFRSFARDDNKSLSNDGRWIGLFAASLVAVSFPQVEFSREARMYSLGTALAAFSSWTLFRALWASTSVKAWTLHALITLLFAYTHHFALFSIAGQIAFLFGLFAVRSQGNLTAMLKDRSMRCSTICYTVVGLLWGLWLPVLIRQANQVRESWNAGPLDFWTMASRCYQVFFDGYATEPGLAALASIAACVGVLAGLVWRAGAVQWYVLVLVVVPYLSGAASSFALGRTAFMMRYLLFAQLFLLVGVAMVVARIRDRLIRSAIAGILVFNGAIICIDSWLEADILSKPGMRAAVAFIEANRRPNEPIIVSGPLLYFPALYYLRDRSACHVYSDGVPFPHHLGGPVAINEDLIFDDQLEKIGPGRVWMIYDSGGRPSPTSWKVKIQRTFAEPFATHLQETVALFEIPLKKSGL